MFAGRLMVLAAHGVVSIDGVVGRVEGSKSGGESDPLVGFLSVLLQCNGSEREVEVGRVGAWRFELGGLGGSWQGGLWMGRRVGLSRDCHEAIGCQRVESIDSTGEPGFCGGWCGGSFCIGGVHVEPCGGFQGC